MFTDACLLYKPEGQHCKVADQDEYDRAIADGWREAIPKDWNNTPDPAQPGGTVPLPPVTPVPPARAIADGWNEAIPKDWNNTPDPAQPGGTVPLPPMTPVPPAKEAKDAPAAPTGKSAKGDK